MDILLLSTFLLHANGYGREFLYYDTEDNRFDQEIFLYDSHISVLSDLFEHDNGAIFIQVMGNYDKK